jgi:2,4-dienoyl-CoA reductase-like NADH-dependent reductase (Old Yellow Enzyme family)
MTVVFRTEGGPRPLVKISLGKATPDPATPVEVDEATGPLAEVNALALGFVDAGKFATMAEARNYVYETRPHMAKAVRDEAHEKAEAGRPPKATQEVGPLETVLAKSAEQLVAAGKAKTIGGAKGRLLIADPTLAEAIRKERAK